MGMGSLNGGTMTGGKGILVPGAERGGGMGTPDTTAVTVGTVIAGTKVTMVLEGGMVTGATSMGSAAGRTNRNNQQQ